MFQQNPPGGTDEGKHASFWAYMKKAPTRKAEACVRKAAGGPIALND